MDRIPAFESLHDLVREDIRRRINKGETLEDMIASAIPEHRSLLATLLTPAYEEEVNKN